MLPPLQRGRSEEKLELITGRLASLRRRVNFLLVQEAVFGGLALMIGAGALVWLAAFTLAPVPFLLVALTAAPVALLGLPAVARKCWRGRVTLARAASLADRRSGLKDRLATLIALRAAGANARLWPYLVEDTLSLGDRFEPACIEPRRISSTLYPLLAACMLAALVTPVALMRSKGTPPSRRAAGEITVPLSDLDLRPMDSDLDSEVEVTGDPEALRKLAEKAAALGAGGDGEEGPLSSLADRARGLASKLQDKLTGRSHADQPRIRLRLAQALGEEEARQEKPPRAAENRRHAGNGASQFEREANGRGAGNSPRADPYVPQPMNEPGEDEPGGGRLGDSQRRGGLDAQQADAGALARQSSGEERGGSGSLHGGGADPNHLFGRATETPLSADSFEIMISARPAGEAAAAGRSYLPPRIRANLNSVQHPDEPMLRSEVPAEDRPTVRRIFQR